LGPLQHGPRRAGAQAPICKSRSRECLIEDCGREFTPRCARSCYCSEECRQAARRWSLRKAQRRYRCSEKGRAARREQARRRRERQREMPLWTFGGSDQSPPAEHGEGDPQEPEQARPQSQKQLPASGDVGEGPPEDPRVGHQQKPPEPVGEKNLCDRPGCYVKYRVSARTPAKRFCSSSCRKAFRRALVREKRWRDVCRGCPLLAADVCLPTSRGP